MNTDIEGLELNGEEFLAFLVTRGHEPVLTDEELAHILDDSGAFRDGRGLGVEADAILFALDIIHHRSAHGGILRRTGYSRNADVMKRHNTVSTLASLYQKLWWERKV
jgi:hypothetical protein